MIRHLLLYLIVIVTISSCASRYSHLNELRGYFNRFEKESHEHGCFIDTSKVILAFYKLKQGTVAFVLMVSKYPLIIIVDHEWWSNASEFDRFNVVRHEGGHAFLLLDHDDSKPDIMNTFLIEKEYFYRGIIKDFYDKCPPYLKNKRK